MLQTKNTCIVAFFLPILYFDLLYIVFSFFLSYYYYLFEMQLLAFAIFEARWELESKCIP